MTDASGWMKRAGWGSSVLGTGMLGITFALLLDHTGGAVDPVLLLTTILMVAAAGVALAPLARGRIRWYGYVQGAVIAYIAWLFLLVYTSTLTENSILFGWRLSSFGLAFLVGVGLSAGQWRVGLLLLGLTGGLSAAWGVAEFLTTGLRANGPLIDPSTWGAIHNIFFFSMVSVFLGVRPKAAWINVLTVIGMVLFSLALFSAYSRVANFVFVMALVFVVIVACRAPGLRRRLAVVVAVGVLSFAAVNLYSSASEASLHSEGYTLDVESYGWHQRTLMWRSAFDIYREYPVFGSGPGTFKVHYPRYRSLDEQYNAGNYAHNDYLQFLAEGGPVLLGFLVALVVYLVSVLCRHTVRFLEGQRDAAEPLLLVVAMGTALTHALMNFPLYQVQVLILLGFLFARVVALSEPLRSRLVRVRSAGLNIGALVMIAFLSLLPLTLDLVSQDLILDKNEVPVIHRLGDDSDSYFRAMSSLTSIRSRNAMNHFGMATIYRTSFDVARDDDARHSLGIAVALEYERGLEINPFHTQALGYYAEFLQQNPRLQAEQAITVTPEGLYRDAVRRFPTMVGPYLRLASYLRSVGQDDQAYDLLVNEALPWANHRSDGWQDARLELFGQIQREAMHRGDPKALERLLAAIGDDGTA